MSTIDLHGCSPEEATTRLDAGLKDGNELAMLGSYPFVHLVTVVFGGGGQVLRDEVEKWASRNQNVCNAPKG
jgi:DNA-nicking Smr family endonuclease